MGEILAFAERAWQGEMGESEIHPARVRLGLEELEGGLAFVSAFSNMAVLETERGLCLFDTSGPFHAKKIFELVRHWSSARVDTAVYTHGHVDHVFGTGLFEKQAQAEGWEPVQVIAHEACAARFDRYQLTHGYNGIINQRQFGFPKPVFPRTFRYPDRTLREDLTLDLNGETVELRHDRGETDDHVWIWLPERKTIYTGDLFIWASPNCGNPRKCSAIRGNGQKLCARCRNSVPSGCCRDTDRRSWAATAFIRPWVMWRSCWRACSSRPSR